MLTQLRNKFTNKLSSLKSLLSEMSKDPEAFGRAMRAHRLTAMRQALVAHVPDYMPIEKVIFDDQIEPESTPRTKDARASRLFFARLGLHAASLIQREDNADLFKIWGFAFLMLGLPFVLPLFLPVGALQLALTSTSVALAIFGFALLWLSVGLTAEAYRWSLPLFEGEIKKDVMAFKDRVLLRKLPEGTPPDLVSPHRVMTFDSEGKPVDGQVIADDFHLNYIAEAFLARRIVRGVSGLTLFIYGLITMFEPIGVLLSLPLFVFAILEIIALSSLSKNIVKKRAQAAEETVNNSPYVKLLENAGKDEDLELYFIESKLQAQAESAASDKSPQIVLGVSTTLFYARNDFFAPSLPGVPFSLSALDLGVHSLVLGMTGSGKTTCFCRPLGYQWFTKKAGGAFIGCAKGALQLDFLSMPGFKLISPEHQAFNPIQGLNGDEVADMIAESFGGGDSGEKRDSQWEGFARELLRSAAKVLIVLRHLSPSEWPWTIESIYSLAFEPGVREKAKAAIDSTDYESMPKVYKRSCESFFVRHMEKADNTRTSIELNLETWLGTIINDELIGDWTSVESGEQVEDVCRGALLGLKVPDSASGRLITQLASLRIFKAINSRGGRDWEAEGETPVLFMLDEAQELITPKHVDLACKARSLGVKFAFATQSVEGFIDKLGSETKFDQFSGVICNMISMKVDTPESLKFVANRMGGAPSAKFKDCAAPSTDPVANGKRVGQNTSGYLNGTHAAVIARSDDVTGIRLTRGVAGNAMDVVQGLAEKIGMKEAVKILPEKLREKRPEGSVEIGLLPLVTPQEIQMLTGRKSKFEFLALASVMRAGEIRRSQIIMTPMFEFPKSEGVSK